MDLRTVEFAVFCIENIAIRLNIPGDQIYQLLTSKSRILDEYIILHYDILHTQSSDYIVDDIIEYMKACEVIS